MRHFIAGLAFAASLVALPFSALANCSWPEVCGGGAGIADECVGLESHRRNAGDTADDEPASPSPSDPQEPADDPVPSLPEATGAEPGDGSR